MHRVRPLRDLLLRHQAADDSFLLFAAFWARVLRLVILALLAAKLLLFELADAFFVPAVCPVVLRLAEAVDEVERDLPVREEGLLAAVFLVVPVLFLEEAAGLLERPVVFLVDAALAVLRPVAFDLLPVPVDFFAVVPLDVDFAVDLPPAVLEVLDVLDAPAVDFLAVPVLLELDLALPELADFVRLAAAVFRGPDFLLRDVEADRVDLAFPAPLPVPELLPLELVADLVFDARLRGAAFFCLPSEPDVLL